MDNEGFVQLLMARLAEGLVMENPGGGTSTIMWCNRERICYKRGAKRLYVDLCHLYEAFHRYSGRAVTTNDLKDMLPDIFDSKQNGHNCNCTFLFMTLRQMGIASEIQGTGLSGNPFWVSLPALPVGV